MSSLVVLLLRGPLIGICLGSCLYGITCLQALFYFRTYVDDRRSLKLTVALLLTLETLHVVLSMWIVDYYLVANYTNELALQSATWFTTVTYSIGFMIDLVVYSYFTWRVWKSLDHPNTNCVLSSTWFTYLERDRGLILAGNVLFVIGDAFSASIMAWHLNKSRDDTLRCLTYLNSTNLAGSPPPKAVPNKSISRLLNILALVFILTQPTGLAFAGPMVVQTRLYSNSLLASLNLRNAHMQAYEMALDKPVELPTKSMVFAPPPCEWSNREEIGSLSEVNTACILFTVQVEQELLKQAFPASCTLNEQSSLSDHVCTSNFARKRAPDWCMLEFVLVWHYVPAGIILLPDICPRQKEPEIDACTCNQRQVALLLTLETIHVALSMWLVDYYLVANYANEVALQSATWFTTVTYSTGFIIDLVVYFYFTWRIWNCNSIPLVPSNEEFDNLSPQLRESYGLFSLCMLSSTWATYLERDRGLILAGIALFVFGDTFSASITAWHLHKSRDGTLRLVNTLAFVFVLIQPVSLALTGPMFVQTRLYSNSLLASLNLRNAHTQAYENALHEPVELPSRSIVFAPPPCEWLNHEEVGSLSDGGNGTSKRSWYTALESVNAP
ncbi:hypothetical protein EV401DRAFT_1891322 [Pisolithus croceorrhizus]|nr:hypothetical protein EV401DRAFT_1891322 [Pisolithus croceorrhizus]